MVQRLQLLASAEMSNAAKWDEDSVEVFESDTLPPDERAAGRRGKVGQYGTERRGREQARYTRTVCERTGCLEGGQRGEV